MKLTIENDVIRKNVEIFKILLKKASQDSSHKKESEDKTYKAYIHRVRGEIRFFDISPKVEEDQEWKCISFKVMLDREKPEKLLCEVSDEGQVVFRCDDIKPNALHNLSETLKVINLMARLLPHIESLPRLFLEFSQINLDRLPQDMPSRDIIHDAWHQVDRLGAERVLQEKEVGTYIFRKDPFAEIMESELSRAHGELVKCVTLSYVSYNGRVCDLTIVKIEKGWLFYNDDPNLDEPIYPTSNMLLESLRSVIKKPLLEGA